LSTKAEVPNLRRRLAFLLANRCRFPGRLRTILPEPVILKRLATALRVLIDFGLLCICYRPFSPLKGREKYSNGIIESSHFTQHFQFFVMESALGSS